MIRPLFSLKLAVLRPDHANRTIDAEVGLQLTRDALIDFCIERHRFPTSSAARPAAAAESSRVVNLPQAARQAELRSV